MMYSPVVVAGSNTHHIYKLSISITISNSTVIIENGAQESTTECRKGNQPKEDQSQNQVCGRPCSNFHLCQKYHPEFWVKAGGNDRNGHERSKSAHPALRQHAVVAGGGSVIPDLEHERRTRQVRTPDVDSDKRDGLDVFSEGLRGRYPDDCRPNVPSPGDGQRGSLGQAEPPRPRSKSNGVLLPLKLSINGLNRQKRASPGADSSCA
nr:ORF4 [Maize-associated tombusvirus]